MQRYGYRRRFLDATSFSMLVAMIAIRGLAPWIGPCMLGLAAPAVCAADDVAGDQRIPISNRPSAQSAATEPAGQAIPGTSFLPVTQTGDQVDLRVELLWAGDLPRRWAGSIHWLDDNDPTQTQSKPIATSSPVGTGSPAGTGENRPQIITPVLLGSSSVLSGGVFETAGGGLTFGPPARLSMIPSGEGKLTPAETRSGGISFRVQGRLEDRATLRLEGDDVKPGFAVNFTVGDLVAGNPIDAMLNDHASVAIRRVTAGDLRVRLGDSATIFWAEQSVDITLINPMSLPIPKGTNTLVLDCMTYSAADDSLVSSVSFPVNSTAGGLHCPQGRWVSPATNGAYRVRLRLRDTSTDRGWLSTALRPTTMANSLTRSITTTLPQSLTTPLNIPLAPFHLLAGEEESQDSALATSATVPQTLTSPLQWQTTHEPVAIAESTLSVAVVAEPGGVSFAPDAAQAESLEDGTESARWKSLGTAVVRNDSSTVSRLFIQPTTQWFSAATGGTRNAAPTLHNGQRLVLLERGQQLEFAVPVQRIGVRHRVIVRVPSHWPVRMVAEMVDIDPSTGVPQPLGPGLAIIRSGQQTAVAHPNAESQLQANAQVSNIDASAPAVSESWHEAVIDFWPRSPATRLVLSNRSSLTAAGIGRIDVMVDQAQSPIYPPAKQNRGDGNQARLAAMRLEISDLFEQFGDRPLPTTARPLDYQQVWIATNRLIDTLRREGYGGVILTVSSDGISLFPDRTIVPDATWNANWATDAGPVDPLRLMLRLFERESLQLIPCIRPSAPVLALEQKIRADASSTSISMRSPLAGQLGAWNFDGPALTAFPLYNCADQDVIAQFIRSMTELNERCRDRGCVPMLGVLVDERSYLRSSPLLTIDEQTLNEFHNSLGDKAPPRESLESWIQKSGADTFQRWRSDRVADGFQQVLGQISGRNLLVMSLDSALPSGLVELGRDRRIMTTRLQRRALTEPLAVRIRDEACNASVPVPLDGSPAPLSYLAATFHQPTSHASGFEPVLGELAESDWLNAVNENSQSTVSALLDPTESSIALAHLVNRSDRLLLAIGGGAVNQPASDVRRRSLRSFAELPPVLMADVESSIPSISSLRVRMATYKGETYIYAVNQTRWPVLWEAMLSRPATVHRLGPVVSQRSFSISQFPSDDPLVARSQNGQADSAQVATLQKKESGTRWQTVVDGGELVAIRVASPDTRVVDWKATFAGTPNQVATIRFGVDDAVAMIKQKQHLRRRDLIANASFEADGTGVPGWMIAQYPADCVAIDSKVAFQGSRSIRMVGQAGKAGGSWIVSELIQPPRSGRLAVSARFRAAKSATESAEPVVVRMALEGTVGGTPIRKTRSVTLAGDGKWSEPQWLEIAKLPNLPLESLRLTIDLMSAGEIWIDDIRCYDQFMTTAERTHWEHLVFLAAGGLSRGDCVAASRLFDSHWALDLVNTVPSTDGDTSGHSSVRRAAFTPSVTSDHLGQTDDSRQVSGKKISAPTKPPAARPGWSDRLKSWLPRPLRFGS